ncbi:MAG: hypothetical protein LBJ64_05215 [Deltaproteobacteria bacterium]|jgi:hypothetical protein|nr:hypothetical protein [Deltaproteobacteria bacterium]
MLESPVPETKETFPDAAGVERSAVAPFPKNENGQSERLLKIELQIASFTDDVRELKKNASENTRSIGNLKGDIRNIDGKIDLLDGQINLLKKNMNIKFDYGNNKLDAIYNKFNIMYGKFDVTYGKFDWITCHTTSKTSCFHDNPDQIRLVWPSFV